RVRGLAQQLLQRKIGAVAPGDEFGLPFGGCQSQRLRQGYCALAQAVRAATCNIKAAADLHAARVEAQHVRVTVDHEGRVKTTVTTATVTTAVVAMCNRGPVESCGGT